MSETETAAEATTSDSLVVKSKAKKKLKDLGLNTAKDALEGLDQVVSDYLARAAARASQNGRKTVRKHDF